MEIREIYVIDNTLIRFIKKAPENCPGPNHPLVMAEAENCVGWIHFIKVNRDPGISHAKRSGDDWLFVDVIQDQYKERNPFYTTSEIFFDNPFWGHPEEGTLSWMGTAFPLLYENGITFIGNGFRWGFDWPASRSCPEAIPVTQIDSTQFYDLSSLFQDDFDFTLRNFTTWGQRRD